MPRGQPAHSLDQVLTAVEVGQTVTGTAEALRCTRQTVYNYRRRWKSVDEAIVLKQDEIVDLAESALRRQVKADQAWAIAFALKTLGKDRGYTERHEVDNSGTQKILIEFVNDWRPASAPPAVSASGPEDSPEPSETS